MPKPLSYSERDRLRLSRTPEFYRRFDVDLIRSGLTVAAYCRKHHVATGTVRKYLRGPEFCTSHRNRRSSPTTIPSLLLNSCPYAPCRIPCPTPPSPLKKPCPAARGFDSLNGMNGVSPPLESCS